MFEFLFKLIVLIVNRKDTFSKAEERLKRRRDYLNDVKEIEQDETLDVDEKRALKNGLSKAICGSLHVNYEILDYFYRSKKISNFEIVTPYVCFWEEILVIDKKECGQIINLGINEKKYKNEIRISTFTLITWLLVYLVYLTNNVDVIKHFMNLFKIPFTASLIIYFALLLLFTALLFFLAYMRLSLWLAVDILKRS